MREQLKKALKLARKTNNPIIFFDAETPEDSFAIIDLDRYEKIVDSVTLDKKEAIYEQVSKRPVFYQSNVLHRNSLKGWKWASDIFAVLLIVINITGLFILKGKHGITGRGKWLIAAGFLPPVVAIIVQALL